MFDIVVGKKYRYKETSDVYEVICDYGAKNPLIPYSNYIQCNKIKGFSILVMERELFYERFEEVSNAEI